MSGGAIILLGGVLSAAVTLALIGWGRARAGRLHVPYALNYRGRRLPILLGLAICGGIFVAVCAALAADPRGRLLTHGETLQVLAALLLVFAGGLLDDVFPYPIHGLRNHGRELLHGRVTSGILKMVAAPLAAAALAAATHQGLLRLALGIPLVAGASNLWNLLDVAPGRALKWFLPAVAVLLARAPTKGFALFEASALGGALIALPFDLAEVAMLGDSGAYVLGFVAGGGLLLRLSTAGVGIALAVVVALHALAETVTLTRVITSMRPLRWFDDLGRRPHPDVRAERSASA